MRIEIEKALVLISQKFREKLSTEQLAEAAGISSFHFHRLFLQETGLTPYRYLEKLRLEHAAHMMALNPEISQIQLAFESGFSSPSVYARAFKKYFGTPPSKYLKDTPNPTLQAEQLEKSKAFSLTGNLEISYLSKLSISAHLLSPQPHKINKVITDHYQENAPLTLYGIFLDAPIHLSPDQCRYLLGTAATLDAPGNYQMEAGYYVSLKTKGNFDTLRDQVIELHKYLSQQHYRIREPIAIEKISLHDPNSRYKYEAEARDIFIPILRV